jgi:hypothetical protein
MHKSSPSFAFNGRPAVTLTRPFATGEPCFRVTKWKKWKALWVGPGPGDVTLSRLLFNNAAQGTS